MRSAIVISVAFTWLLTMAVSAQPQASLPQESPADESAQEDLKPDEEPWRRNNDDERRIKDLLDRQNRERAERLERSNQEKESRRAWELAREEDRMKRRRIILWTGLGLFLASAMCVAALRHRRRSKARGLEADKSHDSGATES